MSKLIEGVAIFLISMLFMIVIALFLFPLMLLHAYIVQDVWSLFVTPIFHINPPGFWYVVGLICFVSLWTIRFPDRQKVEEEEKFCEAVTRILTPTCIYLIIWGMSWAIYGLFL